MMNPDGTAREAFALQDLKSGHLHLFSVCETQGQADALLKARKIHCSHLPPCEVVPVTVQMTLVTR